MYESPYEINGAAWSFAKLWEAITNSKSDNEIDAYYGSFELGLDYTANLFENKITSSVKDGRVVLSRSLNANEEKILKTRLFSNFLISNLDDLDDLSLRYFLSDSQIKLEDWNKWNSNLKKGRFQYHLFKMKSRDTLKLYEDLVNRGVELTDLQKQRYQDLKQLYDRTPSQGERLNKYADSFMLQMSEDAANTNRKSVSAISNIGSIVNRATEGAILGKTFGGSYGAVAGALIGGMYGAGSLVYDYAGESGDLKAISKEMGNVDNMLNTYYNTRRGEIFKKSNAYFNNINQLPDKEKTNMINEFDSAASSIFGQYDLYLKDNLSSSQKLKMLADYKATVDATGDNSYAVLDMYRSLKDEAASRLSIGDKLLNTGALFADSFSGEIIRAAGMVYGIFGAPGSDNDFEHKDDSYWNNIIDNAVTRYGDGIATLHVWDPETQEKYRKLGWMDNEILKTADEENDVWNTTSLYETIGLFGFTAGAAFLSLGSSAILNKVSNASRAGIANTVFKAANTTNAFEKAVVLDKLVSKATDFGHFAIAGGVGTVEGGLEASETYGESFRNGLILYNNAIDKDSETKLKTLAENGNVQLLYDIYTQLGGEKPIEEFQDEEENVDTDSLISLIISINKTITKESPELNKLGEIFGNGITEQELRDLLEKAWKAGYIDFWINSVINGYLNLTWKSAQMSKYLQRAKDRNFGKLKDHINIDLEDGLWKANAKKVTRTLLFGRRLKEAHAEGMEEWWQEIATAFGKGYVEDGIIEAVDNKFKNPTERAVHEDMLANLKSGYDRAFEMSVSDLAMRAYLYGALSTLVGGFTVNQNMMTGQLVRENGGNWMDHILRRFPVTIRTGFEPFFTNVERNKENEQNALMALRFNAFFSDKDKLNLLFNAVGSIGLRKRADIFQALGGSDEADDDLRKSAISALFNVNRLKGSKYYLAVVGSLNGRKNWDNYINKDENGEVIPEDFIEGALQQAKNNDDTNEVQRLTQMQEAVAEFRHNASELDKSVVGTTDSQIIHEVANDAAMTLYKLDDILKITNLVEREYGKYLDDDTKEAFVNRLVLKEYIEEKLNKLKEQYADFLTNIGNSEDGLYSQRNGLSSVENRALLETYRLNLDKLLENLEKAKQRDKEYQNKIAESEKVLKELLKQPNNDLLQKAIQDARSNLVISLFERVLNRLSMDNILTYIDSINKIKAKATALGLNSEKDFVITAADIADLDPVALLILLNEENEKYFSEDLKKAIRFIKELAESFDNRTGSSFVLDMQTRGKLSQKLRDITQELLRFRTVPEFYNTYVLETKKLKQKEYIKQQFSELFKINTTGQTTSGDGQIVNVSQDLFILMLDDIYNDKNITEQERTNRKKIIQEIFREQSKQNDNTMYSKYLLYLENVKNDLKLLENTAYFNNSSTEKKAILRALTKYARSIGKKFNNFSKGGKVIHADDVLKYNDVVDNNTDTLIKEFTDYLERENITEERYSTEEFKLELALIFSPEEQNKIRTELSSAYLSTVKQTTEKNASNASDSLPPSTPKPNIKQQLNNRIRELKNKLTQLYNTSKFISNIGDSKFYEAADGVIPFEQLKSILNKYIDDFKDSTSLEEFNTKLLNAVLNEIDNTSDATLRFWQLVQTVIELKDQPIVQPTLNVGATGGESTNLAITTTDISKLTQDKTLAKVLLEYLVNHDLENALLVLKEYMLNNREQLSVHFVIDKQLAELFDGSEVIPIVVVARVPKGKNSITDKVRRDKFISIEDLKGVTEQYQVIGIMSQLNPSPTVDKIIKSANQQWLKSKNTLIIKVESSDFTTLLNSGSITVRLNVATSENLSVFHEFLRAMKFIARKTRGKLSNINETKENRNDFNEFLKHLYYVQDAKGYKYWVYRKDRNNAPNKTYSSLESDIIISVADIKSIRYLNGNVIDFFKSKDNKGINNFYNSNNTLAIHLNSCFWDVNRFLGNLNEADFEDGVLNNEKAKNLRKVLERYFWFSEGSIAENKISINSLRVHRDEDGFLIADVLSGDKVLTSFELGRKEDGKYISDMTNAYSFMHNLLWADIENEEPQLRTTNAKGNPLLLKILLNNQDVRGAVSYVGDSRLDDTSYNRIYNLFVKNPFLFTTNTKYFAPTPTAVNVNLSGRLQVQSEPIVLNDSSNPIASDNNEEMEPGKQTGKMGDTSNISSQIAENMVNDSKEILLSDDGNSYETTDGSISGERITHFIKDKLEQEIADLEEKLGGKNNTKDVSTSFGNYADEIIRMIFDGESDKLLSLDDTTLLQTYGIDNRKQFEQFVSRITSIKAQLEGDTKIFVKGVVRTMGTLRNKKTGELLNVAGTVDLIAYDSVTGEWFLYDIKTVNLKGSTFSLNTMDAIFKKNEKYWANQLALYAATLEKKYGIKFKNVKNIIIPLLYSTSLYDNKNDYDYIQTDNSEHPTLIDKNTGKPVTGWLNRWDLSKFANGFEPYISKDVDMRDKATIFDEWELASPDVEKNKTDVSSDVETITEDTDTINEGLTDVEEETDPKNKIITYSFNPTQNNVELDPFEASLIDEDDLLFDADNNLQWGVDAFQAVLDGDATLVVTIGDNTTVYDSEALNKKLDNAVKKNKGQITKEDILKEWANLGNTEAAKQAILLELDCL